MHKPRITDLARQLGLSTATVSRALRDMPNVTKATRDLVKNKAREVGYQPNYVARDLRNNKTSNIAIIVPGIANPFFQMLIARVEHFSTQKGYNLFLCDSRNDPEIEIIKIREALKSNVAGILISPCRSQENVQEIKDLAESGRLVQIDRSVDDQAIAWVGLDDSHAMKSIVEHLASRGVKTAAFVTSTSGNSSARLRQKHVLSHAKSLGIRINGESVFDGDFTIEWGVYAAELISRQEPLPDAVICSNDVIALGLISEFTKRKIRVPDDVLVTGLDNISFTSLFSPTLTTFEQPFEAIAEAAVNLLIEPKRTGKNKVAIKGRLIVRESTGS
jgi:LacI family transcriptional regulator